MSEILFQKFQKESLPELSAILEKEYYDDISSLCTTAGMHADDLKNDPEFPPRSAYAENCNELITEVVKAINERKQAVIPYVQALSKKLNEHHDCSSCNGRCTVGHALHIDLLKNSHRKIRDVLFRLQQEAKPHYLSNNNQHLQYRILRNEVMIIDNAISELFYLEETVLIPKILDAQNSINVHS